MKKRETFGASAGAVPSSGVAELEDWGAAALDDEESVAEASLELDGALASAVEAAASEDEVLVGEEEEGMPVAADMSAGAPAGTWSPETGNLAAMTWGSL